MASNKGHNKDIINRSALHAGHRTRIRDRARREGLDKFTEHQFLELVLSFVIARKDTNDLAHLILNKYGSLENLLNTPYESLVEFDGLGEASATFLALLNNIVDYIDRSKPKDPMRIKGSVDAVNVVVPMLKEADREKIIIMFLGEEDNLMHMESFNIGFLDKISIDSDMLRKLVATYETKKVIMVHNHLNGVLYPSQSDIDFTKKTYAMLYFMGVELVDHLIVSKSKDFYSFRSQHDLDEYRDEVMKFLNLFEKKWVDQ